MQLEKIIKETEKLGYKFLEELDKDTLLFKSSKGIEFEIWLDEKVVKKISKDYEALDLTYKEIRIERLLQGVD